MFVGLLATIGWVGRLTSGPPPRDVAYRWDYAVGSVFQFVVMLVAIGLIARGAWSLLALRRPRRWAAALGIGASIFVLVSIATAALDPFLHPGREQGLTPNRWQPSHAGAFSVFAFAVVVLAPLTEELAFRGLGFGLLRPLGLAPPLVGTALLWAFAHGLIDAFPLLAVFGIGLAWLRERQNSTIPGMILHGTFNAVALAASILA